MIINLSTKHATKSNNYSFQDSDLPIGAIAQCTQEYWDKWYVTLKPSIKSVVYASTETHILHFYEYVDHTCQNFSQGTVITFTQDSLT